MKRYILTAFLGAFACIGFVSAYTIDGFTSDSEIYKTSITEQIYTYDLNRPEDFDTSNSYLCSYSSPSPYIIYLDSYVPDSESSVYVSNSNVYCFPLIEELFNGGDEMGIYSEFNGYGDSSNVSQNGTLYLSNSPITYSNSSGGSGGGSSSEGILNATGQAYLGNVITGIQSVVSEFIPYLVYISLGILVVTLGFIAVKWLMNWISRRVTGLFSSRRRK